MENNGNQHMIQARKKQNKQGVYTARNFYINKTSLIWSFSVFSQLNIYMASHAQSVEDYLIDGLSFKLAPGASYVFFPQLAETVIPHQG